MPSSTILALNHIAQTIDKMRLSEQVKKITSIGLFAMQQNIINIIKFLYRMANIFTVSIEKIE